MEVRGSQWKYMVSGKRLPGTFHRPVHDKYTDLPIVSSTKASSLRRSENCRVRCSSDHANHERFHYFQERPYHFYGCSYHANGGIYIFHAIVDLLY